VISVITITGFGDHLRPEWPITFTGIRRRTANPWRAALKGIYRAVDAAAGEAALRAFEEGFLGPEIPTISQSWRRAWGEVVRSMPFPQPRGRDESALPGREIAVLSLCCVADIQSRTTVYRPAAKQGVGVCITSIDGNARDLRQAPTAFRRSMPPHPLGLDLCSCSRSCAYFWRGTWIARKPLQAVSHLRCLAVGCLHPLTSTNRIADRLIVSQRASVYVASFLPRLTSGLTCRQNLGVSCVLESVLW
jgi:hypothetical protein